MTTTRGVQKRAPDDSTPPTNETKKVKKNEPANDVELGLGYYHGSAEFSDITIHYSHEGKIFHGHKIGSESKEIVLKGDDPDSIGQMLSWAYTCKLPIACDQDEYYDEAHDVDLDLVHPLVGIWRVANKYETPLLQVHATREFKESLKLWMANAEYDYKFEEEEVTLQFTEPVKSIYETAGPQGTGSLLPPLLDFCSHNPSHIFGSEGRHVQAGRGCFKEDT
ncbi:hypothetical protein K458DRAFT_395999 [Lentithecium fluviatile CBS 122367]|uniref:BTB domain-containing protein n=1 Tax=Lentithecium fluviatile CBS 122367 TaxID=1168545 RepID=A0A6G1IHP6_9PLEO|nr:hypothetical protein K458DRAFT_395999 [Lentithecium fluviatile CBS 122367]